MNETNLMDYIPPEQLNLIIGAIVTAIVTIVSAIGVGVAVYVRSLFKTWAKEHESKRKNDELERENKNKELEAKIEFQRMEIQRQLDETQTGRETMRLLFSELSESRKEDEKIRASYERRENAHIDAMAKIAQAMQGIETNGAVTLSLLKEHRESDETMSIKQEKLIAQNDKTLSKVDLLASGLEEVKTKLDQILSATQQNPNKKALEQLERTVNELLSLAKATPQAAAATTQPQVMSVTEINETQKELKKEDSQ